MFRGPFFSGHGVCVLLINNSQYRTQCSVSDSDFVIGPKCEIWLGDGLLNASIDRTIFRPIGKFDQEQAKGLSVRVGNIAKIPKTTLMVRGRIPYRLHRTR